ncbi:hypothetical protein HDU91_000599 [Kappamyces sp. JEL0680]|nr:hypothetical protein HDU91_000599 [Kappamyces sp. JEL0680]
MTTRSKSKLKVNFLRPKPLSEMAQASATPFANFSSIVDASGKLHFYGKATMGTEGIKFEDSHEYSIRLDDFEVDRQILGRGQFGIVQKVRHSPSQTTMALKEVRLELEQNKLNHIIMELEVLHKSHHENIIEFYGAFVVENCVYISIEYMDAGSLDKLYQGGVEEEILAKIALAMLQGLNYLKSTLNVIHRDVKPTNVLANQSGQIKLCDFGVSGMLVQSMAKTNVGCQPYLAPERITKSGGSPYSSRSDVWSLGLSLVEMGQGSYPYAASLSESVFAQLSAIVNGESPSLPSDRFSPEAQQFIAVW